MPFFVFVMALSLLFPSPAAALLDDPWPLVGMACGRHVACAPRASPLRPAGPARELLGRAARTPRGGGTALRLLLPGVAKKDTTVTVQGDTLTVEAKLYCHDDDNDDDDDHHHHAQGGAKAGGPANANGDGAAPPAEKEAANGGEANAHEDGGGQPGVPADSRTLKARVLREWTLPEGVDASRITAEQQDGVLTLLIPAPSEPDEPETMHIDIA